MKIPATVAILTFNSESTLARALESVKNFEEIIINDGGSTDSTLAIAKSFGARIIAQNPVCKNEDGTIADFSCVRNQCLEVATYDWFLYIDSDEAVSEALAETIRQVVARNEDPAIYKIPISIFIGQKEIKHSSNYPGYQTRFFNRKTGATFIKHVHERITVPETAIIKLTTAPWLVFMTQAEAHNYYAENKKYLLMQAHRDRSFFEYLHKNVFVLLLNTLKILIKTIRNYVIFGYRSSMPWYVEWGRMQYQLGLMWHAFIFLVKKKIRIGGSR